MMKKIPIVLPLCERWHKNKNFIQKNLNVENVRDLAVDLKINELSLAHKLNNSLKEIFKEN